jgi:excisionase family DNA binding protein
MHVAARRTVRVTNVDERWMIPTEVAQLLKIPTATLYAWRYRGTGPRAVKVGRHLRYSRAELEGWLDAGGSLSNR